MVLLSSFGIMMCVSSVGPGFHLLFMMLFLFFIALKFYSYGDVGLSTYVISWEFFTMYKIELIA